MSDQNESAQPVDVCAVINLVRQSYSDVEWGRLQVTHPTDDDGLWYFWLPDIPSDEVQIEAESNWGRCPFVVETNKHNERFVGHNVEEVAAKIVAWLALPERQT